MFNIDKTFKGIFRLNDIEKTNLIKRIKAKLKQPECSTRFDEFENSRRDTFKKKFFFINFPNKLEVQANLLLDFLNVIHENYTYNRFYLWHGKSIEGSYGSYIDRFIIIDKSSPNKLITLTHEIGHVIERLDFSIAADNDVRIKNAYLQLKEAINDSKLVKDLRYAKKTTVDEDEKKLLEYYLKPNELFTRSYVYYINLRLLEQFPSLSRKSYKPTEFTCLAHAYTDQYWDNMEINNSSLPCMVEWETKDEFKQIKKAWDKLLRQMKYHKNY